MVQQAGEKEQQMHESSTKSYDNSVSARWLESRRNKCYISTKGKQQNLGCLHSLSYLDKTRQLE